MTEETIIPDEADQLRETRQDSGRSLRQRAEDVVQRRPEEMQEIPSEDIQDLIHELQVHQVELELQNEELRRAQQELERSRDSYSDLYEFAPVGYVTVSEKGTILEANLTAATLLGVVRGRLIRQPLSHFIAEDEQDIYYHHRRELFGTQAPRTCEMRMVRGDGRQFWAHIEARTSVDGEGEVVCRATLSDVTERKQAEEELRQSEQRYRTLLQSIQAGVVVHDADTKIIESNAKARELLGMPKGQLLGRMIGNPTWQFLREDGTPMPVEEYPISHVFSTRQPLQDLITGICRPGDDVVWVTMSADPVCDTEGEIAQVIVTFMDITERKQLEEELKRSNEDLEQLGYVISHDLREPARTVKSYLELLENRYQGRLDEKADMFIDYAVDGAERMQEMINALLDLSRVSTRGKESAPIDAEAVLERTLRSLGQAIEEAEAEVTYDPLPTVLADQAQLAPVFQNLIANAIKFRREDVPPHVHISAERMGNEWVFSVADNGIGINPGQANRIFQIFQRLHTGGEYPGLGIGLALCKRIVERHGGRIWLQSKPGEGSTFFFTLPA